MPDNTASGKLLASSQVLFWAGATKLLRICSWPRTSLLLSMPGWHVILPVWKCATQRLIVRNFGPTRGRYVMCLGGMGGNEAFALNVVGDRFSSQSSRWCLPTGHILGEYVSQAQRRVGFCPGCNTCWLLSSVSLLVSPRLLEPLRASNKARWFWDQALRRRYIHTLRIS